MKIKTLTTALLLITLTSHAQYDTTTWLDFWLGDWSLTWTSQDGKQFTGENKITKIQEDKVILEDFRSPSQSFTGTSFSVYNPRRKKWLQTWVDNQGGYITLEGRLENGNPIFESTELLPRGNDLLHFRMIFHSISKDNFIWEWQSSKDQKSWSTNWKINYSRKQ